ncbi:MAG: (4Fe-4S)-binding protein [Ruminococcaceae bacterium]|nr:(4Fe-4S)-binding protein [Oscillospiraceae bacterium]
MLSDADIKRVKGEGFLRNRGTECFSARVITENGVLTTEEMTVICEAAKKFGNGKVSFTSRLTVEVPGIPYEEIPAFREYIAKAGLYTGGTGARVRPIVACKGTTCVFGVYDTQQLAKELHDRFYLGWYDVKLPHKFKIACGGCFHNCMKPDTNDVGIVGAKKETADHPAMFRIMLGGTWGRNCRRAKELPRLYTYDEVFDIVEKSILLFKRDGEEKKRFADLVEKMGIDAVAALFETDELTAAKDEILSK